MDWENTWLMVAAFTYVGGWIAYLTIRTIHHCRRPA